MARKVNFREQVPSFLIVCEGTETERLYFQEFRVGRVLEVTAEGLGKSPKQLVIDAIKLKDKEDYEQVWVVFDIDDNKAGQVNEAILRADNNGINVVYSNQAFELWYLLHFDYHCTSIDRDQYMQRLSRKLSMKYDKNMPGLYVRLLGNQRVAIQNAERLLSSYDHPNPCKDDPCTTVFRLVEELIRYSRDSRR